MCIECATGYPRVHDYPKKESRLDDNELIQEALKYADKLMEKPDVPSSKLVETMNRLAAIELRLRYRATEVPKDEAKKYETLARGISQIISTLKYQAKVQLNDVGN